MKTVILSFVAAVVVAGQTGCKHKADAPEPVGFDPKRILSCTDFQAVYSGLPCEEWQGDFDSLTSDSAIKLAADFAGRHGTDLGKYQTPVATLDVKGKCWYVNFMQKPPVPVGGFFDVVIMRDSKLMFVLPGL